MKHTHGEKKSRIPPSSSSSPFAAARDVRKRCMEEAEASDFSYQMEHGSRRCNIDDDDDDDDADDDADGARRPPGAYVTNRE